MEAWIQDLVSIHPGLVASLPRPLVRKRKRVEPQETHPPALHYSAMEKQESAASPLITWQSCCGIVASIGDLQTADSFCSALLV